MMRFILKNRKAILPLITGLFLLVCLLTGCKETAPPAKPAVVKKRVEQASQTTTAKKAQVEPTVDAAPPQAGIKEKSAAESTPKKVTTAQSESTETVTAGVQGTEAEGTAAEETSLKDRLMGDTIPKYDPTGKIDPFESLFSQKSAGGASEETEPKRPLTPLEKIDISQLHLVAVLQARSGNRAMVEDATGKGYILEPGTFIGINSGTVTKILNDRVIIEEKTRDFFGKEKIGTKELKLQKPFGEE